MKSHHPPYLGSMPSVPCHYYYYQFTVQYKLVKPTELHKVYNRENFRKMWEGVKSY